MKTYKHAYRLAVASTLFAAFVILWGMGAVGIVGTEGDRFDLIYLGVIAIGLAGAFIARGRPEELARTDIAMVIALALITVVALAAGKHEAPLSSVYEIVGLNAFFAAFFLSSAWLFRYAARLRSSAPQPG